MIPKIITLICSLLMSATLTAYAVGNAAFDRIRPIVAAASEALEKHDSVRALSLYTEALVIGQEWPKTEEELNLMAETVGKIIVLRSRLKDDPRHRLYLELMVRPGMEAVYRDANTFGGSPERIPALGGEASELPPDSIAKKLRMAVDLMAADRLKECEKLLISLYTHTWKNRFNSEWRHTVANKLGLLYIKLGTCNQAIDILRANKIDMDCYPDINEDYTETLFYLAIALRDDGMKVVDLCYLETANELASRLNINTKPVTDDYARIFSSQQEGQPIGMQIERFIRDNDRNLSFLTESQREKRWEKVRDRWQGIKYALIDSTGSVTDTDACLNAFQYEKQIMLRSASKTMEALRNADDDEAVALTDSLIRIRQKLAKAKRYDDDEHQAEYERCQKQLLHHHIMNDFEAHLYSLLTAREIADRLGSNETFVDFGTLEAEDGERYFAIIISREMPEGRIIPLCTVAELEAFMEQTHDEEARVMVEKRYGVDFLYEKIWKPICDTGLLNELIYHCPTGMLSLIMPEAISRGGRWLGEDFVFHILSSADAIGDAQAGRKYIPEKLYSFCAIDYYCERNALIANANAYGADCTIYPGALGRDTDMMTLFSDPRSIPPLHDPEDFAWLDGLCEAYETPSYTLTGFNASEHALKYLSGREVGTLNIVTHAFSLPKDVSLRHPYFRTDRVRTQFNDMMEIEVLPLYRTGIMLSGAERAWCSRNVIAGIEDGVVNGEELAALDLHGVDLLTLIACDTGYGDIDPEEGVIGLRRALKMAGCKTLVTTAWNLDKEAGDAYLKEFYRCLMGGSGIPVAHRQAQLELLKRFDNPYYWAVFQLID